MRLIDADLIEFAAPIDFRFLSEKNFKSVLNIIRTQPTIDAAPVVHGRWIPVKERLPETFVPVIVSRKGGKVEQGNCDLNGWWRVYGTRTKKVTHWMPLPEPPEEG